MKQALLWTPLLLGAAFAWADDLAVDAVPAGRAAPASAPADLPAPRASAASAPIALLTEHEGKIWKMQECGATAGNGQRVGNIASNSVAQVIQRSLPATVFRMAAADTVGNTAGRALEDAPDTRVVCVTVTFRDGTANQTTKMAGKEFDALRLRYRHKVIVRFEDGKATDFRF